MNTQELKAANARIDFATRPPKGKIVYQSESAKVYENHHEEKAQAWMFSDLENWA